MQPNTGFSPSKKSRVPKGFSEYSTFNPQQESIFNRLAGMDLGQNQTFQGGNTFLQKLLSGDQETMDQFQAPYLRQFHEQTIPGLAERFAGYGAGAQSSSAFQQALAQAGAGLSENLASLRGQMQLGALPQALQYSQAPFQQQRGLLDINTKGLAPKQKSFIQQLLLGMSSGAGEGAGKIGTSALAKYLPLLAGL